MCRRTRSVLLGVLVRVVRSRPRSTSEASLFGRSVEREHAESRAGLTSRVGPRDDDAPSFRHPFAASGIERVLVDPTRSQVTSPEARPVAILAPPSTREAPRHVDDWRAG